MCASHLHCSTPNPFFFSLCRLSSSFNSKPHLFSMSPCVPLLSNSRCPLYLFLYALSSFNFNPLLSLCKASPWSLYSRNPPHLFLSFSSKSWFIVKIHRFKYWQNCPPSLFQINCYHHSWSLLSPSWFT